jgi:hypothetical protein
MLASDYNIMKKRKNASAKKPQIMEEVIIEEPIIEPPVIEEPVIPIKLYSHEQIKKSISTVYNSVKIINELKSKASLKEEEQIRLEANKKHIELMLSKGWFVEELLEEQKNELKDIVQ